MNDDDEKPKLEDDESNIDPITTNLSPEATSIIIVGPSRFDNPTIPHLIYELCLYLLCCYLSGCEIKI